MSEENKNEEIIPAMLQPGEPLISQETAEAFQDFINESLTEKYNEAVKEAEEALGQKDLNVITSGSQRVASENTTVSGITSVANGVIGTGTVTRTKKSTAKKPEVKIEKVAVHSTKNVTWSGVGKVYRGYNLVTPEEAEKWLTRSHIRMATPEEVAQEFNR